MNWQKYNIREGQQNFTPADPLGLTWNKGFRFQVAFHHSCHYSLDEVEGDHDWYDVNKVVGLTLAYTPNNHLAYMAGWNPDDSPGRILVNPYTNYPGSRFQYRRGQGVSIETVDSIEEAEQFRRIVEGTVTRNSRNVFYTFRVGGAETGARHDFRLPWYLPWIGRRVGTWFGGANNEPGGFGGVAHKDMKFWLQFETI